MSGREKESENDSEEPKEGEREEKRDGERDLETGIRYYTVRSLLDECKTVAHCCPVFVL